MRDAGVIIRTLTAAPLKMLTSEHVGPYSFWAITAVGSERDYRHFLPRILELSVRDPQWPGAEPEVTAAKLNLAGWRTWPSDQQEAVRRFLNAAFLSAIDRHPEQSGCAESWFCALATVREPIADAIDRWGSMGTLNSALQIAALIIANAQDLNRHAELRTGFWEVVDQPARREIGLWLTADDTRRALGLAAERASDDDLFCLFDPALGALTIGA